MAAFEIDATDSCGSFLLSMDGDSNGDNRLIFANGLDQRLIRLNTDSALAWSARPLTSQRMSSTGAHGAGGSGFSRDALVVPINNAA